MWRAGLPGRECLLRAVCEAAGRGSGGLAELGLPGRILQAVFW